MKKTRITFEGAIGIASLFMSTVTMIWIGGYQYSAITHDIREIKEDVKELKGEVKEINARLDKMDVRFERNDNEHHNLDIRLNTLEQHKP